MAQTYSLGHDEGVLRLHGLRNASNSCGFFLHLLKPDFHILDAGSGPGTIAYSLAALVPQGRVVGVDSSDIAVAASQKQEGLPSNCTFQTADLLQLPFADSSFDVVFTSQVLVHIPDAVGALRELRRVVKPGGFVALREADGPSLLLHPQNPGLIKWLHALYHMVTKHGAHPRAALELLPWLREVGFDLQRTEFSFGSLLFVGPNRRVYGEIMARRSMEDKKWRENAMSLAGATEQDFEQVRDGWLEFAADDAGLYCMPCGQVVAYK